MKMKIIRSKGREIPYSDIRKTFRKLLRQTKRERMETMQTQQKKGGKQND